MVSSRRASGRTTFRTDKLASSGHIGTPAMKTILNLCWNHAHAEQPGTRNAKRGARTFRVLATILFFALMTDALPQALPLEIQQETIHFNLRKTNGLPISTVTNVPPGSDGRGPTLAQQQAAGLTEVPPTTNQF